MKAILMSINPKWVEKIASGEKTVEVRKTVPKCGTPFKVHMYETQGATETPFADEDGHLIFKGRCRVVGEFVCDYVDELESEFVDDDCYESVALVEYDEDDGDRNTIVMVDNEDEHFENRYPFKETCLSWEELKKYIGIGIKTFYGLHISDLKIYDKPKELSKFATLKKCNSCKVSGYESSACQYDEKCVVPSILTRPPRSWCYVEELK